MASEILSWLLSCNEQPTFLECFKKYPSTSSYFHHLVFSVFSLIKIGRKFIQQEKNITNTYAFVACVSTCGGNTSVITNKKNPSFKNEGFLVGS